MIHDPNNYWEQLERLEKLIRASEFKAGVIFSFHSLILGIFVDRLDELEPLLLGSRIFIVLSILWMLSVLISVYHCFLCFKPQIEMKYTKNVFFFRDTVYAFGNIKEFAQKLIQVCSDEQELFEQLSEQIHAESKIIDQKFKSVHSAIKYFAISFGFVILMISVWVVELFFQD